MKTTIIACVLALTLGISALFAAGFWEKKKFSEWEPKEVAKLLSDSPWAKNFSVYLTGFSGGGGGGGMRSGGSGGGGGGRGGRGGGAGADAGGDSGEMGGDAAGGAPPGLPMIVRWHSALPVREAIARARFGAEAGSSKEAADMLAAKQPVYIVGIEGIPTKAITGGVDELKAGCELRGKKLPPVQPLQVRTEVRRNITVVYFLFPKDQPGAHVFTTEDDEVEVFLKLESGKISRKFKLKDMQYAGKLEM